MPTLATKLEPQHIQLLQDRALNERVIQDRGYYSESVKARLVELGFARSQCMTPTLVIPVWNLDNEISGYQIRPDKPRIRQGKPVKYEMPYNTKALIDVPPSVRDKVLDPKEPLFITEGIFKADAAASQGLACLGLPGVWGWKNQDEFWRGIPFLERRVHIAFDSDMKTNRLVRQAAEKLKGLLESLGAIVLAIQLPVPETGGKLGIDDFFAEGNTVEDLLALSAPLVSESESTKPADGIKADYKITPTGMVRVSTTKDGAYDDPLTNFSACITAQFLVSDGIDTKRDLEILATVDGQEIRKDVAAESFERMEWVVPELGANAIIYAGYGKRDHARAAIQLLSGKIPTYEVYGHLGWTNHNGEWAYLHAGGAIQPDPEPVPNVPLEDRDEPNIQIENQLGDNSPDSPILQPKADKVPIRVRVPTALAGYTLPTPPKGAELRSDVKFCLGMIDVAPDRIALPLFAAVWRAALDEANFSIHLVGETGSGKSVLMALATQFFGPSFNYENLPASWISTANMNMAMAFLAKNVIFAVDDFVPTGSQSDIERANRDADRILRSQGNNAGRGRCNRDGTPREGKPPRGLILTTGEDSFVGHSLNARVLTIEISKKDKILAQENLPILTATQRLAGVGVFAGATAGFLQWVAPQYEQLVAETREQKNAFREVFQKEGRHARTVDIAADLLAGLEPFLDFAKEIGAITQDDRDDLWARTHEALFALLDEQQRQQQQFEPIDRFLQLLRTAFTTGRAHAEERNGGRPKNAPELWGWTARYHTVTVKDDDEEGEEPRTIYYPQGEKVAWIENASLYLDVKASMAVVQRLARESHLPPIPFTERTLGRRFAEKGLLVTQDDDHYTRKITIHGGQVRLLHLHTEAVIEKFRSQGDYVDQSEFMSLIA